MKHLLCLMVVLTLSAVPGLSVTCHFDLPSDLNDDCKSDIVDLSLFAMMWLIDCDVVPLDALCVALDIDGDGFDVISDCNDLDAAIYPGAVELCDGWDNNCDGWIDETCNLCTSCLSDLDCNSGDMCLTLDGEDHCVWDCSAGNAHGGPEDACPSGYVCTDVGGGEKYCVPDTNSCTCTAGTIGITEPCVNVNVYGTCDGVITCTGSGWGVCDAATPQAEICDGLDNDCNGVIDEGFIVSGALFSPDNGKSIGEACGSGDCSGGVVVCSGDQMIAVCSTDILATAEICDGLDNDCDGSIDEGFGVTEPCTNTNVYGTCEGVIICSGGGGSACDGAIPEAEMCDGIDNDCNGSIDEGC